jgi:hypothetical protein
MVKLVRFNFFFSGGGFNLSAIFFVIRKCFAVFTNLKCCLLVQCFAVAYATTCASVLPFVASFGFIMFNRQSKIVA